MVDLPAGVDPKSMVCEFWRHGQCTKGFKCKYAHDLSVEKKVGVDTRLQHLGIYMYRELPPLVTRDSPSMLQ
jgi:hypothetical protein